MPNSGLTTDAYAEDETLNNIVVRPEDMASQRQLRFVPELFPPPIGGSASTDVTLGASFPFYPLLTCPRENGRVRCGEPKTEKCTLATVEMPKM